MMSLIVPVVIVALIFGGFYYWAQRQGSLTTGQAAEGGQGTRRISLLTEAVAYVGVILLLAGGAAAIGQRWNGIRSWGQVGVFAGAAAFFLLIGIVVRRVREPAIQRLAGVVWFLSVACVAGAVWLAWYKAYGSTGPVTVLVGVAVTVYSAALWLVRRGALQNVALFAGLVVTILGIVDFAVDLVNGHGGTGSAPAIAVVLPLWAFGLAWAGLGWRRYVEPVWVTIPCGVILALIVPIFAVYHGWGYVGVCDRHRHRRRGDGRQHPAAERAAARPGRAGDVRLRHLGSGSLPASVAGGPGGAGDHRCADHRPGRRQRALDARGTSAEAQAGGRGKAITRDTSAEAHGAGRGKTITPRPSQGLVGGTPCLA